MNKTLCILIIFLFQFSNANAQSIIPLNNSSNWRAIGKQTTYFRDSKNLDIQSVLNPEIQAQFQPYQQDNPNFGSTEDVVWLRFTIENELDEDFYLQIGSAFIDSITLYAISDGQIRELQVSGDNYVFSQRPVKVTTFLFPLNLEQGTQQTYLLKLKTLQPFFFTLRVGTLLAFMEDTHKLDFIQGIYLGCMLLILFYNLFLYFSTREKLYLYYVGYVASITWFMSTVYQYVFEFLWPGNPIINQFAVASAAATILTATLFTREFLHTKQQVPRLHTFSWMFIGMGTLSFIMVFTPLKIPALMLAQAGIMLAAIYFLITGIVVYRKKYKPAKFYLVAWIFLIAGFIAAILETVNVLPVMYYINAMQIGSAFEVTLLSLALADRINVYKQEREEAQAKALKAAKENADLVLQQNILLEQSVEQRTKELSKSLHELKAAQAQLVHSEKMASLGELTAGIAHEIQNPLNFVNNFSEVSNELIDEMTEELKHGKIEEAKEIALDIKTNLQKINHHGNRADAIVKSMLAHSRASAGEKVPTNINALADEYLRLSYHGMRAKDKSFNADFKTNFDANLPKVNVIPQDIGRVLLNIINNAFQACAEQSSKGSDPDAYRGLGDFKPIVTVTTKSLGDKIEISISDNGPGIPDAIKDKIFQPFFTTKPTGQGTGLGLSLSYDIIKAQGGELELNSRAGQTTFKIVLKI
ncbi:7TM diverse intracellular signaling domain-containing protein [Shivajiella indica]|uniref:histidine kinase n=1 Tax=Shivajiella indica TaxID=872115 RepID=A0ABW5B3Z1_9BACT